MVVLYERALDRAGRFLLDLAKLGIEAAIADQADRLERRRAQRIVDGFSAALDTLDLDERQRDEVVPGVLTALMFHLAGEGS